MNDMIQIPRAWLERLVELNALIQQEEDVDKQQARIGHLLGYIESAEALLSSSNLP